MKKYVIRRLLLLIPILLGITFLSFALMRIAGSDAVLQQSEVSGVALSPEVIAAGERSWGWISLFGPSISAGWGDFLQEIWAPAIFPAAACSTSLYPNCRLPCC